MRAKVITLTVVTWLLGVVVFEAWRIWSALTGPAISDEYANHLDFQLVASVYLVVFRRPARGRLTTAVLPFATP